MIFKNGNQEIYAKSQVPYLADGTPNPEYFLSDLLHPNAKGYEIWKQVVAGAVKKELDKRAEAAEDAVS